VAIVRRTQPNELGTGIIGNLGSSGRYLLPVDKLAAGRNYLTLAAALNGVPFQVVAFGSVWRVAGGHGHGKRAPGA
jgi:hypothetical protein